MCQRFDDEVGASTTATTSNAAAVEVEDRQGTLQRFPLVACRSAVATTERRNFAHYGEAVDVATEMKQFAKRQPGSSFAIDRRTMS